MDVKIGIMQQRAEASLARFNTRFWDPQSGAPGLCADDGDGMCSHLAVEIQRGCYPFSASVGLASAVNRNAIPHGTVTKALGRGLRRRSGTATGPELSLRTSTRRHKTATQQGIRLRK